MQMQIMIVAALSMTILPTTLVAAVAAMPTVSGTSSEAQEVSSIVVSAIGLSRFGGNQAAGAAALNTLFSVSPAQTTVSQFPPLNAVVEIPLWSQLLTVSILLGIFAAAVSDDEENKAEDSKVVNLVNVSAIAARFAYAAGFFAVEQVVRCCIEAIPSGAANFPSSESSMDIPAWAQLLTASVLLGLFAAAVSEDEEKREDKTVELVRAPAIAARLAVAAGLFGMPGAVRAASICLQNVGLRSSEMFPSAEANADVPMWAGLLLASALLSVFAAAAADDDVDNDKDDKKVVELVRVPSIAARLAVAAALFGAPGAAHAVAAAFGPTRSFATPELNTEVPVWIQFAVVSLLLGVFAMAASDDDAEESKDSKTVNLVRVPAIAARLAVAAGCFAVHAAVRPAIPELSFAGLTLPSINLQSSTTFATSEVTMEAPQWAQLLVASALLGVFAAVASDDEADGEDSQKLVQLIRVPAIAARLAVAAALFGAPGAARAVAAAFGPSANFATPELTTDVPVSTQLAVVSMLLGVFATAVSEEEEKDSGVKLVRVSAIAGRLAVATACFAAHAAVMPSIPELSFSGLRQLSTFGKELNSSANFAASDTTMDVPVWAQLLLVSSLLGVFALATSEDETESSANEKTVNLVRVPAIAARLAVATALFGAPGAARAVSSAFGPSANFPISELNTEMPVWIQFAVVSMLLGVFAALVTEAEDEQDIESGVKLIRPPSIAARLAVAAGCLAMHAAVMPAVPTLSFAGLKSSFNAAKTMYDIARAYNPIPSSPVFASAEATLDTPVWTSLLVVSSLLLVFAVLVRDESADEKEKTASPKHVQLVRPDAIAARLGVAAAAFAVFEVMPPLATTALSGDLLAKGGLLVAGTAVALSGEIQKGIGSKKVE